MANKQVGTVVDFSFINSLRATETGASTGGLNSPGQFITITSLRSALSTYDPITYTTEVLDVMNTNDMVFAVRNCNDPTTIADYITAQVKRSS